VAVLTSDNLPLSRATKIRFAVNCNVHQRPIPAFAVNCKRRRWPHRCVCSQLQIRRPPAKTADLKARHGVASITGLKIRFAVNCKQASEGDHDVRS